MALHPQLPKSPYAVLPPDYRWFPAAEELRSTAYEKLLPPLVAKIRTEFKAWRDTGYEGPQKHRALSVPICSLTGGLSSGAIVGAELAELDYFVNSDIKRRMGHGNEDDDD